MFTAEERRKYIGGSDIAVVMGMSRWKTPLKLWLEKTGQAEPDDLSQVEAVQLGTELEEFVAQKFARETGRQVRRQSKMYVHKDCKTCGAYKEDEWAEVVEVVEKDGKKEEVVTAKTPIEYVLQVTWYLGITGKKVGHIAVLIGGQKFKKRKILFDEELFNVMVEAAKDFWESVQTKNPPAVTPDDNEVLIKMFPKHNEELVEKQDLEEYVDKLQKIKDDISALTDEKEMLEAEIKSSIGENLGILTNKFKVTWKEQQRTQVNSERLKADGLYEKYSDKSTIRRLNVSEIKKVA